ncbi:MAG TPA: diguanylate cyclase [bacterium]|nr:diguanylate cyclase [bacterium]
METTETRILLIEDNPGDALLLQAAIRAKEAPQYHLERAGRLGEGLARIGRGDLDLVLLDLQLPDSSGLETLRSVVRSGPHVPIVVLTGTDDQETAMQAMREGAQDFLLKDDLNGQVLKRSIHYAIERYNLLKRIQEDEERYFLVSEGSRDGLWDWDLVKGEVYFSARWKMMLGHSEEEIGKDPQEWLGRIHPADLDRVRHELSEHLAGKSDHFSTEHRLRHRDGNYLWVLCRGSAIFEQDGKAHRIAGSFTDITHHRNMEQRLALRAFYDPLTGLPNRSLFMEALGRAFERSQQEPKPLFAVLFVDLDGFKAVNDRLGHAAGDELLVILAQRLRSCVRPSDIVTRLAGDEFTVLLEGLEDHEEGIQVARRILDALRFPFHLKEGEAGATVSIGVAFSDCGRGTSESLLKAADEAMYRAKVGGKARFTVFGKA